MARLRRRRSFGSRSKRHNRRLPVVVASSLGVVVGVGLLMAVAHVHGNPPDSGGSFPNSALATLSERGVSGAVSLGALVLIAWCVRQLRFEFLAWWPGPIVVHNFMAPEGTAAADVERLTTSFRDRLGMSHLQSSAAVPAAAEQGDFLDVLGRGGADAGGVLGLFSGLLRAGLPAYGYEVKGALVTRKAVPSQGVTVHVVRLPGTGAGGHTVWDRSWEGAMRQAADHATAAILPRTRGCRSPWSAWRRYYMPPSLLRAYEEAAECEEHRRYDEALDHYYDAVGQDPMNYGLRLQIGYLQEKLGLYLDALDTYEGILTVAEPPDRSLSRAYRGTARHDRESTELVTRYRRAVLLGGEELPEQWRRTGDPESPTKRDKERRRLRERLASPLTDLFDHGLNSPDVGREADPVYAEGGCPRPTLENWRRALDTSPADTHDLPDGELEQLLLGASLYTFGDVLADTRDRSFWRRAALTPEAVRVSQLIVRERLRLLLSRLSGEPGNGLTSYMKQIEGDLSSIERSGGFERWQEHYNAACIYALPLPTTGNPEQRADVDDLAERAVVRLRRASERADSAFIASRRDWLLSEDPDLRGLRTQRQFTAFEAAYFPSASRPPQRPSNAHPWEASRYPLDLLQAAARRWEDTWQNRAGESADMDTEAFLQWCDDDVAARRLVREVAVDHRDWQTRNELVKGMGEWGVEYGFEPLRVPFPRFSADDKLARDTTEVEGTTNAAIERHQQCLAELDTGLRSDVENGAGHRAARAPILRQAQVARLCALHADLWRRAREVVTPGERPQSAAEDLARVVGDVDVESRNLTPTQPVPVA